MKLGIRAKHRGSVCRKDSPIISINNALPGTKGEVAHLQLGDDARLQKLMVMGFLPGVSIEVLQRFPSHLIRVGHSHITIDREMASGVYILLADNRP